MNRRGHHSVSAIHKHVMWNLMLGKTISYPEFYLADSQNDCPIRVVVVQWNLRQESSGPR